MSDLERDEARLTALRNELSIIMDKSAEACEEVARAMEALDESLVRLKVATSLFSESIRRWCEEP